MNVLHWSDTHVGESPQRRAALAALVAHALTNYAPSSTVVVVSGDVTHNGEGGEYKRAGDELARLRDAGFLVLCVPGNHDCGPLGLRWVRDHRARFDALWRRVTPVALSPRWPQVVTRAGWRFVLLDSCEGNDDDLITLARGELGARQLARLEVELQQPGPVVVVLHHHPISADVFHALDEERELVGLLGRRATPLVLFGHMHARGAVFGHKGIGAAYDAGQTTEPQGDAYTYHLHRCAPDGSVTTRAVRVPVRASPDT